MTKSESLLKVLSDINESKSEEVYVAVVPTNDPKFEESLTQSTTVLGKMEDGRLVVTGKSAEEIKESMDADAEVIAKEDIPESFFKSSK